MSIRWLRNLKISGEKTTVEVFLGEKKISDKCYVRINQGPEQWFMPESADRQGILNQGIGILQKRFEGMTVTDSNDSPYTWH